MYQPDPMQNPQPNTVEIIHRQNETEILNLYSGKSVYYKSLASLLRYIDVNNLHVVKTNC